MITGLFVLFSNWNVVHFFGPKYRNKFFICSMYHIFGFFFCYSAKPLKNILGPDKNFQKQKMNWTIFQLVSTYRTNNKIQTISTQNFILVKSFSFSGQIFGSPFILFPHCTPNGNTPENCLPDLNVFHVKIQLFWMRCEQN